MECERAPHLGAQRAAAAGCELLKLDALLGGDLSADDRLLGGINHYSQIL